LTGAGVKREDRGLPEAVVGADIRVIAPEKEGLAALGVHVGTIAVAAP